MAVDLKIEVFAHNLFEVFWNQNEMKDDMTLCCTVYKENHHYPYENYEIAYKAVVCRQIIYQTPYRKRAHDDYSLYSDSMSDFSTYIRRIFREPLFTEMNAFEHLLSTCAFVFEVHLCFQQYTPDNFLVNHAHLCWAMYVDHFIKESFYSAGGWDRFYYAWLSYEPVYKMLENSLLQQSSYIQKGISISNMERSIRAFAKFLAYDANTNSKDYSSHSMHWVRYHTERRRMRWQKKSNRLENPADDSRLSKLTLENIIFLLQYFCCNEGETFYPDETDDSAEQMAEEDTSASSVDSDLEKPTTSKPENVASATSNSIESVDTCRNAIQVFIAKWTRYHLEEYNGPMVDAGKVIDPDSSEGKLLKIELKKVMRDLYRTNCCYLEFTGILREVFEKEWNDTGLAHETVSIKTIQKKNVHSEGDQMTLPNRIFSRAFERLMVKLDVGNGYLAAIRAKLGKLCNGHPLKSIHMLVRKHLFVEEVIGGDKIKEIKRLIKLCNEQSNKLCPDIAKLKLIFPKRSRPVQIATAIAVASEFVSAVKDAGNPQSVKDETDSEEKAQPLNGKVPTTNEVEMAGLENFPERKNFKPPSPKLENLSISVENLTISDGLTSTVIEMEREDNQEEDFKPLSQKPEKFSRLSNGAECTVTSERDGRESFPGKKYFKPPSPKSEEATCDMKGYREKTFKPPSPPPENHPETKKKKPKRRIKSNAAKICLESEAFDGRESFPERKDFKPPSPKSEKASCDMKGDRGKEFKPPSPPPENPPKTKKKKSKRRVKSNAAKVCSESEAISEDDGRDSFPERKNFKPPSPKSEKASCEMKVERGKEFKPPSPPPENPPKTKKKKPKRRVKSKAAKVCSESEAISEDEPINMPKADQTAPSSSKAETSAKGRKPKRSNKGSRDIDLKDAGQPDAFQEPGVKLENPLNPKSNTTQSSQQSEVQSSSTVRASKKKKSKRKTSEKQDGASTKTNTGCASEDSMQTSSLDRDVDEVLHNVLRFILVLGDPMGVNFIKSTL